MMPQARSARHLKGLLRGIALEAARARWRAALANSIAPRWRRINTTHFDQNRSHETELDGRLT
jgi:hypothetical protein